MKKLVKIMMVMMAVMALAVGCGGSNDSKEEAKQEGTEQAASSNEAETKADDMTIGFIFIGPIGDGGYTYAHNEGRLELEEKLGVKTIYKESVPEGPEVEKVLRDMVDQGANAIFATSFGYMDYVEKVAKDYPEVKFLHCSGYKSGDNFVNYFGRMYEPRFLSGLVAGMKTKTNKIGYVGAFEIPEVVRGINAFTLGVKAVNPEAEVDVRWTHTWYDPAKEKEAAKALLDAGSDVIAQHQDTAGPQQAAEEAGAFAIGYNTDSEDKAPKAYMTAPVWNWGVYYVDQVQKMIDGTWTAENKWGGMDEDMVRLSPLTQNAPEEAKAVVAEYEEKIKSGEFKVFGGVIKKQDGTTIGEDGKVLDDQTLLGMDWFVDGVKGSIK